MKRRFRDLVGTGKLGPTGIIEVRGLIVDAYETWLDAAIERGDVAAINMLTKELERIKKLDH